MVVIEDSTKLKNDIALSLYHLKYDQLNEFSQEFVDDVVQLIANREKLARIEEAIHIGGLWRPMYRGRTTRPQPAILTDDIFERIEQLKENKTNEE